MPKTVPSKPKWNFQDLLVLFSYVRYLTWYNDEEKAKRAAAWKVLLHRVVKEIDATGLGPDFIEAQGRQIPLYRPAAVGDIQTNPKDFDAVVAKFEQSVLEKVLVAAGAAIDEAGRQGDDVDLFMSKLRKEGVYDHTRIR